MTMIVSVGAAEFLPYLGFWNRIAHADKFVITDTSKYKHRDYMNRNRIRTGPDPQVKQDLCTADW